jgi:hypothetical protein
MILDRRRIIYLLFAPDKGWRAVSAWAVAVANAREDLLLDVASARNICVSFSSPDVGDASLATICSMIWAAMQEFPALPIVDVGANVVRDRAAATAESIAIESH